MATDTLILNAASLLSDDGENTEYDRAIVELVALTLGLAEEERDTLRTVLTALR